MSNWAVDQVLDLLLGEAAVHEPLLGLVLLLLDVLVVHGRLVTITVQ